MPGHDLWPQVWRTPDPKPAYEVALIGGGSRGLGAAYFRQGPRPVQRRRNSGRELNFNIMFHERGMIMLLQTEAQVAHARGMAATMGLFGSRYILIPRVAMAPHDAVALGGCSLI